MMALLVLVAAGSADVINVSFSEIHSDLDES
jgi:hypothetical protein